MLPLALAALLAATPAPAPAAANTAPPEVMVHGGAGSPRSRAPAIQAAAEKGLAALKAGRSALEAAIAATVALEDDCAFNAGTGANVRMDGKTVQMDAAVMDGSSGAFGAVAAIERVKNPVLVARKVMDTPHILIVGDGATRFARAMGFTDHDPVCPDSRARYERIRRILAGLEQGPDAKAWKGFDWVRSWNFPAPVPVELKRAAGSPDTVGAVARDASGRFAAAISTGGTTITFYGRVGDVPIYGAGIYAGPHGAVACTGVGEEIVKHLVAKSVYDELARGVPAQEAVERALSAFPEGQLLGVIAISAAGDGAGANWSPETKAFNRGWRENMPVGAAR